MSHHRYPGASEAGTAPNGSEFPGIGYVIFGGCAANQLQGCLARVRDVQFPAGTTY
jgi:hypothetical protein